MTAVTTAARTTYLMPASFVRRGLRSSTSCNAGILPASGGVVKESSEGHLKGGPDRVRMTPFERRLRRRNLGGGSEGAVEAPSD